MHTRGTDGRVISDTENPHSFSHARIEQAADRMAPGEITVAAAAWTEIATIVADAADRFEAAVHRAVEPGWEGAAADAALSRVHALLTGLGELAAALDAQTGPLHAAAGAAARFRAAVPPAVEAATGSDAARARNAAEEQVRDDMANLYLRPYTAIAPTLPSLPAPPAVAPAGADPGQDEREGDPQLLLGAAGFAGDPDDGLGADDPAESGAGEPDSELFWTGREDSSSVVGAVPWAPAPDVPDASQIDLPAAGGSLVDSLFAGEPNDGAPIPAGGSSPSGDGAQGSAAGEGDTAVPGGVEGAGDPTGQGGAVAEGRAAEGDSVPDGAPGREGAGVQDAAGGGADRYTAHDGSDEDGYGDGQQGAAADDPAGQGPGATTAASAGSAPGALPADTGGRQPVSPAPATPGPAATTPWGGGTPHHSAPAVSTPPAPGSIAPTPMSSGPALPAPMTSGPAVPTSMPSGSVVPAPAASGPAVPAPTAPGPALSGPAVPGQPSSGAPAPGPAAPAPMSPGGDRPHVPAPATTTAPVTPPPSGIGNPVSRSGAAVPAQSAPGAGTSTPPPAPTSRPTVSGMPGVTRGLAAAARLGATADTEHHSPDYLRSAAHSRELLGERQKTVPPALGADDHPSSERGGTGGVRPARHEHESAGDPGQQAAAQVSGAQDGPSTGHRVPDHPGAGRHGGELSGRPVETTPQARGSDDRPPTAYRVPDQPRAGRYERELLGEPEKTVPPAIGDDDRRVDVVSGAASAQVPIHGRSIRHGQELLGEPGKTTPPAIGADAAPAAAADTEATESIPRLHMHSRSVRHGRELLGEPERTVPPAIGAEERPMDVVEGAAVGSVGVPDLRRSVRHGQELLGEPEKTVPPAIGADDRPAGAAGTEVTDAIPRLPDQRQFVGRAGDSPDAPYPPVPRVLLAEVHEERATAQETGPDRTGDCSLSLPPIDRPASTGLRREQDGRARVADIPVPFAPGTAADHEY